MKKLLAISATLMLLTGAIQAKIVHPAVDPVKMAEMSTPTEGETNTTAPMDS